MARTACSKLLSFFLVLFITACGGGSGSDPRSQTTLKDDKTSSQSGSQTVSTGSDAPASSTDGPAQNSSGGAQSGGTNTSGNTPPGGSGSTDNGLPGPVASMPNATQRENAKGAEDGVTAQWEISDQNYASNHEIEGYASATSVNRGESIKLYVNTSDPEYTISVYRIGWYKGAGGRLVAGPIHRTGVQQPAPTRDAATNLIECDWSDPYVLDIPYKQTDQTDWASGVYLAKLTGSSGKESYIIFVVRDDARDSALLFQSAVTTYAAYNNWGGYSLYALDGDGGKQGYKVSFNRPYRNPLQQSFGKGAGEFFSWEINMVRFLEREGYDVTYSTNIDTHRAPQQLQKYRAFLSVGHDEYWSKNMRDAMEAARDSGVNLAFFGANSGYWQVRLEASSSGQANRTVVAYKYDTRAKDPMYQTDPTLSTYLWREAVDPPLNRPEAALVGVMYDYNSVDLDLVIEDCPDWICAGTSLHTGSVLKGMLGYEVDTVAPSSPTGIIKLGASPYSVCIDTDCKTKEVRYANMTYYTAPSGAGVFATGSMNWHWGLDAYDDGSHGNRQTFEVKKITQNILTRFIKQ